ncbi:MAG: Rpn family recombination-promoting nuclease/putative transposase [Desulfamplus sp.]|nr:Rpn family recombination-promoting nuclease/putative transposase [Desulfamplus sp.]
MIHKIDPIVDCVFKALLGSERNKNLLIHFLNAVIGFEGDDIITDVVILNPYNEREFIDDKLSIVDIKAKSQNDFKYQVEIQLAVYPALPSRIIYNWCTIYHSQINKKEDYAQLKPVYSIWIIDTPLFKDIDTYHFKFGLNDLTNKISLSNQLSIQILQLSNFDENKSICNEAERWLYFFKQAANKDIDNLPDILKTEEMIQAMETLKDFSENQRNYLLYQSRIDKELELNTFKRMVREAEIQLAIQKEKLAIEQEKLAIERQQREHEKLEKEKALREKELYLKILKEKGIDVGDLE